MSVNLESYIRTIEQRVNDAPTQECKVYITALAALEEIRLQDPSIDIAKLRVRVENQLKKEKKKLTDEFAQTMRSLGVKVSKKEILNGHCSLPFVLKDLSAADKIKALNAISKLVFLNTLNLAQNELTLIPDMIGNLGNLTFLKLASNKLKALPVSLGKLKMLKDLDVSRNSIQTLPDIFDKLIHLENFVLIGNPAPAPGGLKYKVYK